MSAPLAARLQYLLPKRLISALVYRVARTRVGWLKRALIRWFARTYRVDMREAAEPDLDAYATFNAFFTRALKAGARPLYPGDAVVVSPCDGRLTQFGAIDAGTLIQAKGLDYDLDTLLGTPAPDAVRRGRYATIYLAPHDYHRVHVPLAGRLQATRYIPGARFAVNAATAAAIPRLFCRNERVVGEFATDHGPMYVVLVGALNVSSVSTVPLGEIASGAPRAWSHDPAAAFARGAEFGRFNLGSTVVLILPDGPLRFAPALAPGLDLKLGVRIAEFG